MAKILIVEDHKDIQALLQDVLAPTYEVVQAFDGIQALTQFHQTHPDLVILDLMLPNVTGECSDHNPQNFASPGPCFDRYSG